MIIGILRERKEDESRVSMTPAGVEILKMHGHTVLVEEGAGVGSAFTDAAYVRTGAELLPAAADIFARAEMILRVKEPLPAEYALLRPGQVYFSYLHLAASKEMTRALLDSKCVALAYETVQKSDRTLPLLMPMSEVAGRMAIQEGAKYLEIPYGGQGVLMGGVPGVDPGMVVIIGGGVVGTNAAKMACGMGAKVHLLDINLERLRYLSDVMPANCFLRMCTPAAIREMLLQADLVVGAVLNPGAKTPKLVSNETIATMKKGAVIVDVSIDQGGFLDCSRPMTHSKPVFDQNGVVIYCVENMPGVVAKTSTLALTNATLPYVLTLANMGWQKAAQENSEIKAGLNIVAGKITCKGVADAAGLEFTEPEYVIQ